MTALRVVDVVWCDFELQCQRQSFLQRVSEIRANKVSFSFDLHGLFYDAVEAHSLQV